MLDDGGGILWRNWAKQSEQRAEGSEAGSDWEDEDLTSR